jgi:hypothetical protein
MTDQVEKLIRYYAESIAEIAALNPQVIAEGKFSTAYSNLLSTMMDHFETALVRWRRGESPVADLQATLAAAEAAVASGREWGIDDDMISSESELALLPAYAGFFVNQHAAVPADWIALIRKAFSRNAPSVVLELLVLDALEDRPWRRHVDDALAPMSQKKQRRLAFDTYRTYFALLQANGDGSDAEFLVRAAEQNYTKRLNDSLYSGSFGYLGGGDYNPHMIDFELAAILKKIGWTGESIHRWRWD